MDAHACVLARDLDGFAEMIFARQRAVGFGEDQSHDAMRLRIAWREPDGVARMGFAFHPLAAREQHGGELVRRPQQIWIAPHDAAQQVSIGAPVWLFLRLHR